MFSHKDIQKLIFIIFFHFSIFFGWVSVQTHLALRRRPPPPSFTNKPLHCITPSKVLFITFYFLFYLFIVLSENIKLLSCISVFVAKTYANFCTALIFFSIFRPISFIKFQNTFNSLLAFNFLNPFVASLQVFS